MAELKGKVVFCDRCSKQIFLKSIGEGEGDGGFTRWNQFEPLPEGWGYARDTSKGYQLCPKCYGEYTELIRGFENG